MHAYLIDNTGLVTNIVVVHDLTDTVAEGWRLIAIPEPEYSLDNKYVIEYPVTLGSTYYNDEDGFVDGRGFSIMISREV